MSSIFAEVDETCHFSWRKACPMLMPDAEPLPFVLAPGLFYACALDSLASTLEVASIGGWNSGSLTLRYLEGLPPVVTGGRGERGNP